MRYKFLKYKIVPISQSIIGAILLISELINFFRWPNKSETYFQTFAYKENTYSWIFLDAILLFAGLSYFINKKIHWVFNIAFLVIIAGIFFVYSYLSLSSPELAASVFFALVFVVIATIIGLILNRKQTNEAWLICKRTKFIALLIGLLFTAIFWRLVFVCYW